MKNKLELKSSKLSVTLVLTVVGAVISGFASAAYPEVWAWFKTLFGRIGDFFLWIWHAFTSSYAVPGWILLILIGTLIPFLIIFASKRIKKPAHYGYIEDHISGGNWSWEWSWGVVENIKCFCVFCQAELVDELYDAYESTTHFFCENCNERRFSIHGGRTPYVHEKIKREIDRRIRTKQIKIKQ